MLSCRDLEQRGGGSRRRKVTVDKSDRREVVDWTEWDFEDNEYSICIFSFNFDVKLIGLTQQNRFYLILLYSVGTIPLTQFPF